MGLRIVDVMDVFGVLPGVIGSIRWIEDRVAPLDLCVSLST